MNITPEIDKHSPQGPVSLLLDPTENIKKQAECYQRLGFSVFRLGERQKLPAKGNTWKEFQSNKASADRVRTWWDDTPNANIGLAMGQISGGIIVIDVDQKPGQEGADTLHDLQMAFDDLPETWEAQTGGGGRHLYYRCPPDVRIPNKQGFFGKDLDIRGDGGLVVGVGSIHESGKPYEWRPGHAPHEFENEAGEVGCEVIPGWLLDCLKEDADKTAIIEHAARAGIAGTRVTSDGVYTRDEWGRITDGRKNYMYKLVYAICMSICESGEVPDRDHLLQQVWPIYVRAVAPRETNLEAEGAGQSLLAAKVDQILKPAKLNECIKRAQESRAQGLSGAASQAQADPLAVLTPEQAASMFSAGPVAAEGPQPLMRPITDGEPYPVDALLSLTAPVRAIESLTQAPAAIAANSVLAAVALCVQGHANIVLPTGQAKPVSLFLLTCAGSGERKSAVDNWALEGINSFEKSREPVYAEELASFNDRLDIWEAARKAIINEKKKSPAEKGTDIAALGPRPQEPVKPTLCFPEPTFEGLAKNMAHGRPDLGFFSQEGGAFIGGHAMSEDKKLMTAAGLSSLWDGSPLKRLRAGDGASVYRGRRLSFHLMAQPDVTAQLLSDRVLLDQGLISRFLVTAPPSVAGTRKWKDPCPGDLATVAAFQARTVALLSEDCPTLDGSKNELDPREIPMSPEARDLWIRFYEHVEKQAGDKEASSGIVSLLNKLPEHAARLATALALFDDIHASRLEGQYMAAGIELAQHYAAEARRLSSEAMISVKILDARHVLKWLQDKWTEPYVSLPDIYKNLSRIKGKAAAKAVAETLVDHGWLIPCSQPVTIKGKKRRDVYQVVREVAG